jgi:hypothetical protein
MTINNLLTWVYQRCTFTKTEVPLWSIAYMQHTLGVSTVRIFARQKNRGRRPRSRHGCVAYETSLYWKNNKTKRRKYSLNLSESYVTTDGQSASLSWNKATVWGLRPDFYYCQPVAGLMMWGALSDEKTGLSFRIDLGPRQRSKFRVQVPWNSWPYFTASDWRLPFSSPPTSYGGGTQPRLHTGV